MDQTFDPASSGLVPSYIKIKNQMTDSFYRASNLIYQYRLMPDRTAYQKMMKLNTLVSFKSALVEMFMNNRTTFKEHKKTSEKIYPKLKVLVDKYAEDVTKMTFKEAIAFFEILENGLYLIGLLNVNVSTEESDQFF